MPCLIQRWWINPFPPLPHQIRFRKSGSTSVQVFHLMDFHQTTKASATNHICSNLGRFSGKKNVVKKNCLDIGEDTLSVWILSKKNVTYHNEQPCSNMPPAVPSLGDRMAGTIVKIYIYIDLVGGWTWNNNTLAHRSVCVSVQIYIYIVSYRWLIDDRNWEMSSFMGFCWNIFHQAENNRNSRWGEYNLSK